MNEIIINTINFVEFYERRKNIIKVSSNYFFWKFQKRINYQIIFN